MKNPDTTKRGSSIITEMAAAAAVKAEGVVYIYCWPRVFTESCGGGEEGLGGSLGCV